MQNQNLETSISSDGCSASTSCSATSTEAEDSKVSRIKWTRYGILRLIDLRKKFEPQFQSTITKNDTVWKQLAAEMKNENINVTPLQCQDKWKYLKCKYNAKKDNMSSRCSGEDALRFEFFPEMDNFLGKKHNVTPVALASSSKGYVSGKYIPKYTKNEFCTTMYYKQVSIILSI